MSLHRLTHNVLRANHHVGNSQDAHRMVEGQEGPLEWEDPVDQAPAKRTSSIPGLQN